MGINTRRVRGRRKLHFESMEDIRAEAGRLAAGRVRTLGNWSLGQILMHLAKSFQASIEGLPGYKPPLWFKLLGPLLRNRVLNHPMKPGVRLPARLAQRIVAPAEVTTASALAALNEAMDRYDAAGKLHPHAFFGRLTREQWDKLHLRHCEMHLSFAVPVE